jgi:hypothetical protein
MCLPLVADKRNESLFVSANVGPFLSLWLQGRGCSMGVKLCTGPGQGIPGNTNGGSIIVPLTSCLTGLELAV